MTREEAIEIASQFLLERHKHDDNATIASILLARDEPATLAHYLRQHIEFLTKVSDTIDKKD